MNQPVPLHSKETGTSQFAELDLRRYLTALLVHKWTIASLTVASLAVTTLYTLRQPILFEARATVMIDPKLPQVLSTVTEVADLGITQGERTYYTTQYKILMSDVTLAEASARFDATPDGASKSGRGNATSSTRGSSGDPAAALRAKVVIEPVKDSRLVYILVRDPASAKAAALANLIGEVYVEQNLTRKLEAARGAEAWLEVQTADLRAKLHESELGLHRFLRDKDVVSVSLEDRKNVTALGIETTARALNDIRVKRMQLTAEIAEVGKVGADRPSVFSLEAIRKSGPIQLLDTKRRELEMSIARAAASYTSQHPTCLKLEAELAEVERQLRREKELVLEGVASDVRTVTRFESELTAEMARLKREAQELGRDEMEYNRLKREYDTYKNLHALVMTRLKETSLSGHLDANNVRLFERAKEPVAPVAPNILRNLVVGLFLGIMAGAGAAILRSHIDDTVKNQEDVESALGVAFLGIIPTIPVDSTTSTSWLSRLRGSPSQGEVDSKYELYVHTHPASAVAEHCRVVRSNLLFMSPDEPLQCVAVSSPDRGSGKTGTAVKLGISMAQMEGRTLLVDADMRCPKLHRIFGVANDPGLSTVIAGGATLEQAIRSTEVAGLDLLPSGKSPPQPAELLHSRRFAELVAELKGRYSSIFFDTPPVMGLADTIVLSRQLNGVVLVAKWRKSRKEHLRRVLQNLVDLRVDVLGVIINDVNLDNHAYYYYQYGNYGKYTRDTYTESSPV